MGAGVPRLVVIAARTSSHILLIVVVVVVVILVVSVVSGSREVFEVIFPAAAPYCVCIVLGLTPSNQRCLATYLINIYYLLSAHIPGSVAQSPSPIVSFGTAPPARHTAD
jgi:hypothetical protein